MGERTDPLRDGERFPEPGAMSSGGRPQAMGEMSSDPEVIAQEIEATRDEMSQTVDAIQDRLDPERITGQAVDAATEVTVQAKDAAIEVTEQARDAAKDVAKYAIDEAKTAVRELADQAKQSVRASTIGRAEQMAGQGRHTAESIGSEMLTLIRQNPLPAALTAAGIAWLWMERSSGSHQYGDRSQGYSSWDYRVGYVGPGDQATWQGQQSAGQGQPVMGQAQQVAGQVAGQAQQMAGQVVGQAQEMTGQVAGQAQQTAEQLQYRAKSMVQGMSADPLAIGAIGLAMGAVAALLLPETEQERHLMGDARDRVMSRVQEVGAETVDKVQQVAAEAGKAAMEEAKAQGMTQQGSGSASSA